MCSPPIFFILTSLPRGAALLPIPLPPPAPSHGGGAGPPPRPPPSSRALPWQRRLALRLILPPPTPSHGGNARPSAPSSSLHPPPAPSRTSRCRTAAASAAAGIGRGRCSQHGRCTHRPRRSSPTTPCRAVLRDATPFSLAGGLSDLTRYLCAIPSLPEPASIGKGIPAVQDLVILPLQFKVFF
jgi:hypothetical protein